MLDLQNAQVKKGQTLGYVEQLGTFVEVKVSVDRITCFGKSCSKELCHSSPLRSIMLHSDYEDNMILSCVRAMQTPIAGELVKIHLEDGAAVEYQQLIAEVAPFFGGHIIGDSKYA